MAKKKSGKSSRTEKDLKAKVARLRRRLDTAESAVDRWRKKAKKHKSDASSAEVEISRLRKRLDKATTPAPAATKTAATKTAATKKAATKTAARKTAARKTATPKTAAPRSTRATAAKTTGSGGPDATWTLSALRAEAKRRQLTGYSRATKSQLITRLR